MSAAIVLAALLALHPPAGTSRSHAPHTGVARCVELHRRAIERVADRAERELNEPASVLLSVARRESHWGCRGGRSWGAPHSRRNRFGLGTAWDAALALEHSFRVCGTWQGAVGRFRSGLCHPWNHVHQLYVRRVMRDVELIHARTETPTPDRLR